MLTSPGVPFWRKRGEKKMFSKKLNLLYMEKKETHEQKTKNSNKEIFLLVFVFLICKKDILQGFTNPS